jgi:hypothetical protein
MEAWRIYWQLLDIVSRERPLILSWLQRARPRLDVKGAFHLCFQAPDEITLHCLTRRSNHRLISNAIARITKTETEPQYSLVSRFT